MLRDPDSSGGSTAAESALGTALFRHGASMLKTMQKENVAWPQFKPAEMSDLIAFLNSRLVPRVARREN